MVRTRLSDLDAFSLYGHSGGVLTIGFDHFADGYLYLAIGAETLAFSGRGGGCCSIQRLAEFLDEVGRLFVAGRDFAELSSTDLDGGASIELSVIDRRGTIAVRCRLTDELTGFYPAREFAETRKPVGSIDIVFPTDQSYVAEFVRTGTRILGDINERVSRDRAEPPPASAMRAAPWRSRRRGPGPNA